MSDDYLWDGSGTPEPDVQRLEALLGRLRASRPEAPAFPARTTKWTTFRFAGPALGAAAAGPLRGPLEAFGRLATAAIGVVLAGWGASLMIATWALKTPGAPLPTGLNFLPFVVGGTLMALFAIERDEQHPSALSDGFLPDHDSVSEATSAFLSYLPTVVSGIASTNSTVLGA